MLAANIHPDQALELLMAGNQRYANGKPTHPHQNSERRMEVIESPRPLAVLLSCADSRVPPEILFDLGIGDLFVIRTAGNIIDEVVLGSIEFGSTVFGIPLVIVMGHTLCGAVISTVNGKAVPGHIGSIVSAIQPAVDISKDQPGDPVMNATIANVRRMVEIIQDSQPILAEMVQSGRVKVVAAIYHIDSGVVELL